MLGQYESVIVYNTDLKDKDIEAEVKKCEDMIKSHAGTLSKVDIWGRRQLAYRIAKKEFGIYVLVVFEGDNTLVAELDRALRINEGVLRHLIVKKDKYAPDFSAVYREEGLPSEDLPFVDDGDASFDLMAGKGEQDLGIL